MATCPAGSIHAFLTTTTPVTEAVNTSITAKTYPFISSFADNAAFSLDTNLITTSSYNSIAFKGNPYGLYNIQLCQGSSRAISTMGSPLGDLILTFTNTTVVNGANVIIVILPIYVSAPASLFLSQLLTNRSTNVGLGSLFIGQRSYGYYQCISTGNGRIVTNSISTYIISFPNGCFINADPDSTSLNAAITNTNYIFYSPYHGGFEYYPNNDNIALAYTYDTNNVMITPTQWSGANRNILSKGIDPAGDDFKNNVLYYTTASPPSNQGNQSALFTLDQYKCYPFSKINNVDAENHVISLSKITQAMAEGGNAGPSTNTVWGLIGFFIGLLLLAGVFFIVYRSVTTKPTIPPAAFATMNTANNTK
uniref:Uncharacterized protein n=1 Tax=viral metagenome TaxID=1070528 RepID=A0A6C0JZX7_9ZZZZ